MLLGAEYVKGDDDVVVVYVLRVLALEFVACARWWRLRLPRVVCFSPIVEETTVVVGG